MHPVEELAAAVSAAFQRVHHDAFRHDPAANPALVVEVVDATLVADTPVVVLVAPWTVSALVFPPDATFADTLALAGRPRPVLPLELPGLPPCRSIPLPVDPMTPRTMSRARALARSWLDPLHEAVRATRRPLREQAPPGNRPPRAGGPG